VTIEERAAIALNRRRTLARILAAKWDSAEIPDDASEITEV